MAVRASAISANPTTFNKTLVLSHEFNFETPFQKDSHIKISRNPIFKDL